MPRPARPAGLTTGTMSRILALVPAIAAAACRAAPGRRPVPPAGALRRDRGGSVAIMTAILGGALAGFVALAVDVGTWEANRSAMQGAADQAAMAASYAILSASMAGQPAATQTAAARKEARGLAAAHGYVDGAAGVTVAVNIPPSSGSHTATARAIEVVITQPQQVLLGGMITNAPPLAAARAVAVPGPVNTCLMALSPTGYGITDVGLGTVATNCNIYVNSAASPTGCDVALVGVVALTGYDVSLGQPPCPGAGLTSVSATHRLRANAAPAADPYAARVIPAPTRPCMPTPSPLQLVVTLNPGTYCSDVVIVGLAQVNLNPGVYVFDGASLSLGALATLTGNGVTLVFTSSNGSSYGSLVAGLVVPLAVTVNLTPMTTGPTAGIVLWLDPNGATMPVPQALNIVAAASVLNINGAIYAPAAEVDVLGVASAMLCTQIVASKIHFFGIGSFHHTSCAGYGVSDVIAYKLLE